MLHRRWDLILSLVPAILHLSLSFFLFSPLILLFLPVSLMEWAHSDFEASHLIYLSISGKITWCAPVLLSFFHSLCLSLINVGSLHQFLECRLTQHKCSWLHSASERHEEHANEVKSANVFLSVVGGLPVWQSATLTLNFIYLPPCIRFHICELAAVSKQAVNWRVTRVKVASRYYTDI